MVNWLKDNKPVIFTIIVTVLMIFYIVACEPKVKSLNNNHQLVTRQELQFELENILRTAELRMAQLDQQERIRQLVLQNALLTLQGTTFNPVGLITAIAALYGLGQAGTKVTKAVKKIKGKVNNG